MRHGSGGRAPRGYPFRCGAGRLICKGVMMNIARNFICPVTEAPCANPRCRMDRCATQLVEQDNQALAEKQDFERRLRHGLVSLEELGL